MQQFQNASAGDMVVQVAASVIENRAYLSEIDGKIGDGDHGVNTDVVWDAVNRNLEALRAAAVTEVERLGRGRHLPTHSRRRVLTAGEE